MKVFRHLGLFTVVALLAVLVAACGGSPAKTTTTTTPKTTTNTGTTANNMDGGNMMQGITITPDMAGMNALIRTGKATISGSQVSVLLTTKGFAVYTYKPDTALMSTCTGACAKDWPPVLAPKGTMTVSSSVTLAKPLSVHQTANGLQVFYDGHALYTYAEDTKAGVAMGHGADTEWYLVNAALSTMATNTGNMMQGITITPDMTANTTALIHTGKATINGTQTSLLLTSKNFAVYTYKPDTAFKATCTGDCAKDWPPVLASNGMMTVSSSVTLPKQLSVHQTANGAQVFYDGHALYTYAEDKQAGVALGNGQDTDWYLVNSMLNNMATTNNGNMIQGIAVTLATTGNTGAFIHTGKAAINGNQVNVLLTNKGFALYYYKADTAFKATCTGACAKDWPPVLAPNGMMAVSSAVALPKLLSVHQTANGAQVFYDGHALYTYATDTQAGIATGRGQDMLWYMVGFLL